MEIRKSTESERNKILDIHKLAFGKDEGPEIAELVNNLFNDETAMPMLSLVAVDNDKLVGHVLFTKLVIKNTKNSIPAKLLAPLAILPNNQKMGIGQKLVNEGLKLLKESGTHLVFVLGHPTYYPRCDFIPAGEQGFEAPYPIPQKDAEAWMIQELKNDIIKNNSGKAQCSKALDQPQYWRE